MILQKLKAAAEDYLGEKVTKAVITVPAYFNDSQRQATKDAGQIAGLEVMRLVNEPTAAALAYGLDKKKDETIAVYDFGGGTFDISILEVGDGRGRGEVHQRRHPPRRRRHRPAASSSGWPRSSAATRASTCRKDRMALQRLKEAAEKAKIELSPGDGDRHQPALHHGRRLRAQAPQREAHPGQVRADDRAHHPAHPRARAARRSRTPASSPRTSTRWCWSAARPASRWSSSWVKELFGKEPHKGVNPDEVVAVGAAIQAGVLGGEVKDVLLLDVTPLSLGVETLGGVTDVVIPRNTTIPTRKSKVYSTADDNQNQVEIHVLQGERPMAARQPDPRALPPRRHPAGAARHPADRGDLRHRRQRHSARLRQGPRHRQGAEDPDHRSSGL